MRKWQWGVLAVVMVLAACKESSQGSSSASAPAGKQQPASSAWMTSTGKTKPVVGEGEPLLLSPVVIAMWKPMAEAPCRLVRPSDQLLPSAPGASP